MNIGFHNKRICPNLFDRIGAKPVAFFHNGMIDLFDCFGTQQTERVSQCFMMKFRFIKTAESHDGSQPAMIFREVLQLVVSVIAAQANSGKHANVPVLHALATGVGA